MTRLLLVLALFLILAPAAPLAAQSDPVPVPEGTALPPGVGEQGPQLRAQGQPQTMRGFIGAVAQDANVMWATLFASWGLAYIPPTVVTVEAGAYARSSCGINVGDPADDSGLSPFLYCPYGGEAGTQVLASSHIFENQYLYAPVIYLSESWLDRSTAGAPDPGLAAAYVVTHTLSHHIERQLGYTDHHGNDAGGGSDADVELMTDCLAGVWASSAYDIGHLDEADVDAALSAIWAEAGTVEEFGIGDVGDLHADRLASFMAGYGSARPSICLTA